MRVTGCTSQAVALQFRFLPGAVFSDSPLRSASQNIEPVTRTQWPSNCICSATVLQSTPFAAIFARQRGVTSTIIRLFGARRAGSSTSAMWVSRYFHFRAR